MTSVSGLARAAAVVAAAAMGFAVWPPSASGGEQHACLVARSASDNNFPFSNGRSRARSADRSGPLAADDTEVVLVRLGRALDPDRRLLARTPR